MKVIKDDMKRLISKSEINQKGAENQTFVMWNSRSKVDALTPKTTVPWSENQTYFKLKKEINRKGERERYKSRERGERERERLQQSLLFQCFFDYL